METKRSRENRGSRSMMNLNVEENGWSMRIFNSSGSKSRFRGKRWEVSAGDRSSESFRQHEHRLRRRGSENWGNEWPQQQEHQSHQPMPPYQPPQHHQSRPPYKSPQSHHPRSPQRSRFPHHSPHNQGPRPSSYQGQNPPHHQSHTSLDSKGSKLCLYPQDSHQFECSEDTKSRNYSSTPPPSYEESEYQYENKLYPTAPSLETLDEEPYVPNSSPTYKSSQQPVVGKGEKLQPQMQYKSTLNPKILVKALARCIGHCGTVEDLSTYFQRSVEEVVAVARSRKDIFSCKDEDCRIIIELVPKVHLCKSYFSQKGCLSRDSCRDLHLCKFFATGFCNKGISCSYGHHLYTDHNSSVLSKFHLDVIDKEALCYVLRKVCKGSVSPRICQFYNGQQGCTKTERCPFFHICIDYVMGCGKCCNRNCSLSHSVFTKRCERLLNRYGISTNGSPRDILMYLKSSHQKEDDDQSQNLLCGGEYKENRGKKGKAKKSDGRSDKAEYNDSSSDSDHSLKSDVSGGSRSQEKNRSGRKFCKNWGETQNKKLPTCQATHVCGDVKIPEICIFAINGKCNKEIEGCRYLHAKSTFHWQVKKDRKWYNFRVFHSKQLEEAYQDVSKDGVRLSPLYPNKLDSHAKEMLKFLITESWMADFKDMTIKDSSARGQLEIRRISTESAAVCDHPKATVYEWYFRDEQSNWIRYGHVDSLDNQQYVCPIKCGEIEKWYSTNPSLPMMICNAYFKYKLDFKQMTQTNLQTNKVREIRRRPRSLASDRNSLPEHWISMSPSKTSILVPLDYSGLEYQKVASSLKLTLPAVNIHKIRRLQNPYLWKNLQNKKENLSLRYNEIQMNIQRLFHGINPVNMETICSDNTDWRQGISVEQNFGKGTYFSNSAAVARLFCTQDKDGHSFLLLVEVVIGTMAVGCPTFTRPPLNTLTNERYDTTVDDIDTPNIYVKYDKREYYPEYIIEFS